MGEESVYSRAINKRNIWEQVMKEWCCDGVADKFMLLKSKDAQNKMLDAFKAKVMQLSMDHAMDQFSTRFSGQLFGTSFANPFVSLSEDEELIQKAMRMEGSVVNIHDFNALRYDLKKWGKKKGNKEMVKEHEKLGATFKEQFTSLQIHTFSQDITVTKDDKLGRHTKNLKEIKIKDLKLFETCIGCSLEGTLVGYGRLMVGIILMLEDSIGDIIQLAIYNIIPDGPDKYVIAEKYFPHGRRIKIIEPFMKIFKDGNRGIRVDIPDDVCFVDDDRYQNIDEIRVRGKRLMKAEQFCTAFDLYKNCLQSNTAHLVSLLNNRSQAELKLNNYEEALLDAAAVLFIEEENEKANYRYDLAFKKIQSNCKDNDEVWKKNLQKIHILEHETEIKTEETEIARKSVGRNDHVGTKKAGNEYYTACQYQLAQKEYTSAINFPDISLLLTNMAIAAINMNMFQTAIAACSACLRIAKDRSRRYKALYLMSKSFLKLQKLFFYQEYLSPHIKLKEEEEFEQMCFDIKCQNEIMESIDPPMASIDMKGQIAETKITDFLQPDTLEHVYIKGKGRGIRALRDIKARTILLVDQLIIGKATEESETTFHTAYNHNRMIIGGELKLTKELMGRIRYDGLLFKRLQCLEHRQNLSEENVPLPLLDLKKFSSRHMDEAVPPFLSQSNEVLGNDMSLINQVVIENIISVNTFSYGSIHELDDMKSGAVLSMRISLLNHDDDFNCSTLLHNDALVLFPIRDISKGEELTIYYKDGCQFSKPDKSDRQ